MRISSYITSLVIIALIVLTSVYIDWVQDNIVVISGLATACAFVATAWTAFEARASATAAMEAVNLTSHSLYEIRKTSFKQWFELLLEQHKPMHDEVQSIMSNDKSITNKIYINFLSSSFSILNKRTEIIKYINHIISILEFIDKDFYTPNADISEKRQYVEQLTNNINSDVMLVIAILGLKVFDNGTYKPERLYQLLNKYDFFAKECFFKEAFDKINQLDHYVKELFDAYYRKNVTKYIEYNILNHQEGIINPLTHSEFKPLIKTNFVVMWGYNNLCHRYLKIAFDELPKFMKGTIEQWLKMLPTVKREHDDIFRNYVGYELNVPGQNPIKIKAARHLRCLTDVYLKNPEKYEPHTITLTKDNDKQYFINFALKIEEYKLTKALLILDQNPDKDTIILKILNVVNENITYYKEKLNEHTFNN